MELDKALEVVKNECNALLEEGVVLDPYTLIAIVAEGLHQKEMGKVAEAVLGTVLPFPGMGVPDGMPDLDSE